MLCEPKALVQNCPSEIEGLLPLSRVILTVVLTVENTLEPVVLINLLERDTAHIVHLLVASKRGTLASFRSNLHAACAHLKVRLWTPRNFGGNVCVRFQDCTNPEVLSIGDSRGRVLPCNFEPLHLASPNMTAKVVGDVLFPRDLHPVPPTLGVDNNLFHLGSNEAPISDGEGSLVRHPHAILEVTISTEDVVVEHPPVCVWT
mmetsp:Transcript_16160/g.37342  ORF Transcript_16160/g.37342 Transcript_16160/m.37342 type:complete len:203 (+) Transcript_16160:312-920(+)